MSWLARSLANSLRLDDEQELKNDVASDASHHQHHLQSSPAKHETSGDQHQNEEIESSSPLLPEEEAQSRGVKEDLTELKQTLTKQLWGVASFLAPPPPPPPPPPLTHRPVDSCHRSIDRSASNLNQSEPSDRSVSEGEEQPSDLEAVSRISGGFAEIGGSFRSGVSGISKMALNYFPFGSEENERESLDEIEQGNEEFDEVEEVREEEEEDEEEEESWEDAVGITDEVLAFAGNIAMHPETWLDFPLDEEEDLDDFDISDAQRKHALAIEYLAPRLAALRFELCPCHMSESYFWKVYFVLLHSRLNKHDAEILSTPQVMEARALWMQELQKQTKLDTDWFGRSFSKLKDDSCVLKVDLQHPSCNDAPPEFLSPRIYAFEPPPIMTTDYETVKHPVESSEIQYIDKTVVEEKPVILTEDKNPIVGQSSKIQIPDYEDDEYVWPEDEDLEFGGCGRAPICPGDEEDISFSDLEDDGDCNVPIKSKIVTKGSES